ncbi:hydroxymethylpyrimidine pyrophosphatase-like HAD family hydrolase [Agromyces cerinus]|uniref:HAD family hydrolase n=1 Tax=Agromyces cerinus TaxID=33878 RepID=UPI0019563788|nr:HAD family hydrolase [Agromyces cerinus]MBM7831065.1 hydroxymethylpyrimidine pyrophosphatase-like HAD family hydrolase [Agromyces cerinus]
MSLVIATDLDGTIAFDNRRPDRLIRAVLSRLVFGYDARLVVATARSPRVLEAWFGSLGPFISGVCCNGALVSEGGREVHRAALLPELVREVALALGAVDAAFCLDYGDGFVESRPGALPWMGERARRAMPEGGPRLDGVVKLCVADGAGRAPELTALAGGRAEVFPHATGDADVVAAGTNKANGLARILADDDVVLALGNDLNDLELLRSADRAVVVGTGLPGIERLGHVVRTPADIGRIAATLMSEARGLAPWMPRARLA